MSSLIQIEDTDIMLIDGDRGTNYPSKSEFYDDGYCLFLDAGNITDKGFDFSEIHFITKEKDEMLRSGKLQCNDIVMMTRGSVGNVALYDETVPFDNIRINSGMIIIRCKEKFESLKVYYLLKSNFVQKQIKDMMSGSVQKQLPVSIINKIKVLNDSINIGAIYALDKKVVNNININAELELIAKTIFDYWFLQFEFPNEEGKPYKSSGGKMVWNEELKKEIPKGWKIDFLGNLFTSNRGISYNSKTIEGSGVPMINLASFNVDGTYKEEGIKTYSGQYTQDRVVKPFDLLMCNTQQTAINYKKDIIGKAFLIPDIFDGDVVTSHHVTTIQVKKDSMKYFLHRLFNTDYFHKYVAGFTNGTNILGLIFSGIERYRLEIPDDVVLGKFAELMQDIEIKKSKIIKENQELVSLRDFLLPLLMNGQVGFKTN